MLSNSPRFLALSLLSLVITGCGLGTPADPPLPGPLLHGIVRGGQQPVSGATLNLYSAGTTGYGTGATTLYTTTTGADGSFTLTGHYTCPASTSQLYLVASGGNPGLAAGTNNTSLVLLAALGPCALHGGVFTLDPNAIIQIDEVTTIASAFALSGFINATTEQIGASSTNATGLANAFATVSNLANIATGSALATVPNGNGAVPQTRLNALANILAPCANSTGSGPECAALFAAATPSGGTAPADTLQAAISIATHPASQVSSLYTLSLPNAPFQPALTSAPNDWTLAITFTGGVTSNPVSMVLDAAGSPWIVNNGFSLGTSSVTKFSNLGVPLFNATGGSQSFDLGIAIDQSGNAWVSGYGGNSNLVKISNSGSILSGASGYTAATMDFPRAVAIDATGLPWVSNYGGTQPAALFKFQADGSSSQSFTATGITSPGSIAIDAASNLWIANSSDNNIARMTTSGTVLSGTSGYAATQPATILIGTSNTAWFNGSFTGLLNHLSAAGSALSGSGYPVCVSNFANQQMTCQTPDSHSFAIDGAGNLWSPFRYTTTVGTTNTPHWGFAELNTSGTILSGSTGIATDYGKDPISIAIDNSGNLWGLILFQGTLFEIVGVATPTVTPISVATTNGTFATRP